MRQNLEGKRPGFAKKNAVAALVCNYTESYLQLAKARHLQIHKEPYTGMQHVKKYSVRLG